MRIWFKAALLGTALAIGPAAFESSSDLLAAAEAHTAEKGGGEEHKEGVPSMDAEAESIYLATWSLVTFLVFLFVLRKYAWGPLIEGLNKRETGVLDNIAGAEAARIKAEKLLA